MTDAFPPIGAARLSMGDTIHQIDACPAMDLLAMVLGRDKDTLSVTRLNAQRLWTRTFRPRDLSPFSATNSTNRTSNTNTTGSTGTTLEITDVTWQPNGTPRQGQTSFIRGSGKHVAVALKHHGVVLVSVEREGEIISHVYTDPAMLHQNIKVHWFALGQVVESAETLEPVQFHSALSG